MFVSKKIRYFMAVAQESSFRNAADKLYMSITPVTKGVHDIESFLGYKLFYRSQDGVKLTRNGKSLYEQLKPVVNNLNLIERNSKIKDQNKISIAIDGFYFYGLSDIVNDIFISKNIAIDIIKSDEKMINNLILSHEVDLFILNSTSKNKDFHFDVMKIDLGTNEVKIIVSRELLYQYSSTEELIKNTPIVQLSSTARYPYYDAVHKYRKDNEINTSFMFMADINQVLSLVASGSAISFTSSGVSQMANWGGYNIELINSPIGDTKIYRTAFVNVHNYEALSSVIDKFML